MIRALQERKEEKKGLNRKKGKKKMSTSGLVEKGPWNTLQKGGGGERQAEQD